MSLSRDLKALRPFTRSRIAALYFLSRKIKPYFTQLKEIRKDSGFDISVLALIK